MLSLQFTAKNNDNALFKSSEDQQGEAKMMMEMAKVGDLRSPGSNFFTSLFESP